MKIQLWRKMRRKLQLLEEEEEMTEKFDWISTVEERDIYYCMSSRNKTYYKKGDQLFNCYGRRTNRFLLINYGFCLRNNKYNSLGFKVFVNYSAQKPIMKRPQEGDSSDEEKKSNSPSKLTKVTEDNEVSQY